MQQMHKPYSGLFLTIEGGEGSGKSTLCQELGVRLTKRGFHVVTTREPGGVELSEKIRQLLLNHPYKISDKAELLLFLAARSQHFEEKIQPALREGNIVICERFNDSTIAYQGCARGLGMDYVEKICHLISEHPDFTLLLDNDPQVGITRMQASGKLPDRIEQEKVQFHREVRRGFLHLADEYPDRIAVLDASLPIEQVVISALDALQPHLMIHKP